MQFVKVPLLYTVVCKSGRLQLDTLYIIYLQLGYGRTVGIFPSQVGAPYVTKAPW